MKVILLRDVRGLGRAGEVKDVADGYSTNFLFPHKYAVAATEDKIREIEATRAAHEAEEAKAEEQLGSKIDSLSGKSVTIAARATEKGGLFKGITEADISKAIRSEHSLEIFGGAISLESPIKKLGEHKARLSCKSRKADLAVIVTAL